MMLITQVVWSGVELRVLQRPNITKTGAYLNGSEFNREKLMNACSGLDYDRICVAVFVPS
jgi:hypothetical protein